jgi:hypothetical protein
MGASQERTALYRRMNQILIDDCVTISGISRTLVLLWNRAVVMLPDVEFVGGFFFRFARPAMAKDETVQASQGGTGSR